MLSNSSCDTLFEGLLLNCEIWYNVWLLYSGKINFLSVLFLVNTKFSLILKGLEVI